MSYKIPMHDNQEALDIISMSKIEQWDWGVKPVATVLTVDTLIENHSGKYLVDATAGPITITLQVADICKGSEIFVKKVDASVNSVLIVADTTLPDLIDGETFIELDVQYQTILISSNPTGWYIM